MDTKPALERAIALHGGPSRFAEAVNESPQTITNWLKRGVPAEKCPTVELVTNGKVRCEELNNRAKWWVLRQFAQLSETR